MKKHLPKLVYLLGLGLLAFWQDSLRSALGDWLSLLVIICYLLVLRLIGQLAVQLIDLREKREIERFNLWWKLVSKTNNNGQNSSKSVENLENT